MSIIFSEGSGLNDSVFGKVQAPVRMFLEKRDEEFEKNSCLKDLFKMGKSDNFGDLFATMTAMDGFEPVGENGAYPSDSMQEGYSKLLVYETFKDSFAISQEIIEDGKLMNLDQKPQQFIAAYHRTRENFGASIYGHALQGKTQMKFGKAGKVFDITSADGLAQFHTAHPSKVGKAAQSNKFADAFSLDALDRMEEKMQLFKGDNGEQLSVAPDTIVIPLDAELRRKVFAAIGSTDNPLDATHAFNYQYGRWTVICNPYLNQFLASGAKPWMLMDSKYNETYGGAVWNDRIPLTVKSVIDDNDANRWKGRARFGATFNDWRFCAAGGMTGGTQLVTG